MSTNRFGLVGPALWFCFQLICFIKTAVSEGGNVSQPLRHANILIIICDDPIIHGSFNAPEILYMGLWVDILGRCVPLSGETHYTRGHPFQSRSFVSKNRRLRPAILTIGPPLSHIFDIKQIGFTYTHHTHTLVQPHSAHCDETRIKIRVLVRGPHFRRRN